MAHAYPNDQRRIAKVALAFVAGLIAACCASARAAVTSLDDIRFWTGSGAKRAGFVVDWNGDTASDAALAWGYRFSGAATGEDMLRAVIAADPRLYAKLGGAGSFGVAVRGVGYDANDDNQFALDDGTTFDADGVAQSGPTDGGQSLDVADLYHEGWLLGAWTYGTSNSNPWTGGAWTYSMVGATDRQLVDGAWDSWAFTSTFKPTAFAANAAAAVRPADFDSSGAVDGDDFLAWQRGLGLATALRAQGDATGDHAVNGADLAVWRGQFSGSSAAPASFAIPEPLSSSAWASTFFFVLNFVRQRRRSVS